LLSSFNRRYRLIANTMMHLSSSSSSSSSSSLTTPVGTTPTSKAWEVEQKFTIPNPKQMMEQLKETGFVEVQQIEMVDWYFDVPPTYPLIRQDCWLRYRTVASGNGRWELKRGNQIENGGDGKSKATVYEEIEGDQALLTCQRLITNSLQKNQRSDEKSGIENDSHHHFYEGQKVPMPPIDIPGLSPIARIVTHRSTWHPLEKDDSKNLIVDLDTTDFGHAVGEVERLVTDKSQIETALQDLQAWLRDLLGEDALKGSPPMGKLECYLSTRRPEILEVLVDAGLMPARP